MTKVTIDFHRLHANYQNHHDYFRKLPVALQLHSKTLEIKFHLMKVFAVNIVKDTSKMERQDTELLFLSSLTCHSEIEAFFRIRWDIRDIMRCTLLLDDQRV